ncbi:hypothetical protein [Streptomyces sp. NPDC055058]
MTTTALEKELRTAATRLRDEGSAKGHVNSNSRELLETIRILLRLRGPIARWLEEQAEYVARSGMYDVLAVDVARLINSVGEPARGDDGHIEDRHSGAALYERLKRAAGETVTALAPAPALPTTDHGQDLDHLVCCDEDTALCGADVSTHAWGVGGPAKMCDVCRDLKDLPCSRCEQ